MNIMMLKSAFCLSIFVIGVHCSFVTLPGALKQHIIRKTQNASDIAPGKFISGGEPARVGQFPWIALLSIRDRKVNSTFMCGGSLISKRHVLTAAHCLTHEFKDFVDIKIYLGEYDTESFPIDCVQDNCTKNLLMIPDKIIPHTGFNKDNLQNDIALLRFKKDAPIGGAIQLIPLPPFDIDDPVYDDTPLLVTGWGDTEYGDTSILLTTEIHLIPQQRCLTLDSRLPEGHLCAGDPSGKDTCPGDSGGPLMMQYKKKHYLSGVVSYGYDECGQAQVGYYTNVYKYMKWIKNNMKI